MDRLVGHLRTNVRGFQETVEKRFENKQHV